MWFSTTPLTRPFLELVLSHIFGYMTLDWFRQAEDSVKIIFARLSLSACLLVADVWGWGARPRLRRLHVVVGRLEV